MRNPILTNVVVKINEEPILTNVVVKLNEESDIN